ncbi:PREDICTED: interferon gamma receptor 1 [Nanorana parkeri]|uniref:interferon gamma receptor 1 n=1 Tax=Nanorana parkeri TaxID=125878 RepID=UPI000854C140|nr:PREDICTED: interferon gamma receptor 1 [Nanorana parkeri]
MAAPVLSQLAWTLLLCLTSGRPSTASPAEEVQTPFNLTVNSYNFNTSLRWDYNRMEMTAYFDVDLLDKVEMNWMVIEACQNISHHYCDLSHEIFDPLNYYKVRVKALVGSKTSEPATIEFSLSSVGILGPPELDVDIKEEIIVVDIFHPKMPFDDIMENGQLNYMVYCGNYAKRLIHRLSES